jgi:transposase
VTLIAALGLAGVTAAMTIAGALDGAACEAFVREVLGPPLRPGPLVIGDKVRPHQGARRRELIEAAGCEVLFLPPYAPAFNPIEEAFSNLKTALRRSAARTTEALTTAIGAALDLITPADAAGWFGHCGYLPLAQPS